ncbi:GNAT family N-acetyltransferase [bacterium]|nr:GNAT family N-acetyltransferase [bacterium]
MKLLHQAACTQLRFRELTSCEELHQLFRLRHLVYSSQGYWDPDSRRFDVDAYDRYSRFVGAFFGEELIGGSRLIMAEGQPNGPALEQLLRQSGCPAPPERRFAYTAQELMGFEQIVDFARRARRRLVEFGRTVIHPDWQNGKLGVRLVYAIYGLALKYGIDLGLALVPPRLVGFYSRCGCHLLTGKGSTHYTHTELAPVIVDLHALVGEQREAMLAYHYLEKEGEWVVPLYEQSKRLEPLPLQQHPLFPLLRRSPSLEDATLCELDTASELWEPGLGGQLSYLERLRELKVESLSLRPFGMHRDSLPLLLRSSAELKLEVSCRMQPGEGSLAELVEANQPYQAQIRLLLEVDVLSQQPAVANRELAQELPTTLWLQNASQAEPEQLEPWLDLALAHGCECVCLSDSQGLLTPEGATALLEFVQHYFLSRSAPTRIEWHGGDQSGQALATALAAVEAGADRVHASLSDCHHVPMQYLLLHLHQMAGRALSGASLKGYLSWARIHLGWVDSDGLEARVDEGVSQGTPVSH